MSESFKPAGEPQPNVPGPSAVPAVPAGYATTPPPKKKGHLLRNLLIVFGILVLLVALSGVYVVVGRNMAAERTAAAEKVIKDANDHHVKFGDYFAGLALGSGAPDLAKARTLVDQGRTKLAELKTSDEADARAAMAADSKVQDRNPLTLPFASGLDREHRRLAAIEKAVGLEMGALDKMDAQFEIIGLLLKSIGDSQPVVEAMQRNDYAAAQAAYASPIASIDSAIAKSQAATVTPAHLQEFLSKWKAVLGDIKAKIDAVQSKNPAQYNAAQAQLVKDNEALAALDGTALSQDFEDLGKQLDAPVTAALRDAA